MSATNEQYQHLQGLKACKKVITGTYTVKTGRVADGFVIDNPVEVNDPTAATTITVPDGYQIGQQLLISSQDPNSQTVTISVTHHVTSDPETFTVSTADQWLLLIWTGTEWATLGGDATAT
jgi:hypothetical protein